MTTWTSGAVRSRDSAIPGSGQGRQHRLHRRDHLVDVEKRRRDRLVARIGQQGSGQPGRLVDRQIDLAARMGQGPVGTSLDLRRSARDDGEHVVEVVRHAGGQAAQALQLLVLEDGGLRLQAVGDVDTQARAALHLAGQRTPQGVCPQDPAGTAAARAHGGLEPRDELTLAHALQETGANLLPMLVRQEQGEGVGPERLGPGIARHPHETVVHELHPAGAVQVHCQQIDVLQERTMARRHLGPRHLRFFQGGDVAERPSQGRGPARGHHARSRADRGSSDGSRQAAGWGRPARRRSARVREPTGGARTTSRWSGSMASSQRSMPPATQVVLGGAPAQLPDTRAEVDELAVPELEGVDGDGKRLHEVLVLRLGVERRSARRGDAARPPAPAPARLPPGSRTRSPAPARRAALPGARDRGRRGADRAPGWGCPARRQRRVVSGSRSARMFGGPS